MEYQTTTALLTGNFSERSFGLEDDISMKSSDKESEGDNDIHNE